MEKTKSLCEICSPKQWKTISADMLTDEGYPVYGANGVIGFYSEYNHKEPTLLITCRGATCGALNICEPYSYVNGNAMALDNLADEVDIKYLYYFLFNRGFADVITGSAQPQIVRQSLQKISVTYPDLEKQEETVTTLEKISALITMRKEQLAKLDELVKARFVEMFGSLNDNEKGLDIASIEELCMLIKDGTHQTPTYTEDTQNGFKFLSSKDVMTQKICWDDVKYIPAELHEKLYATIQPKRNDILMSKNGVNYGIAAVNDTDEVFDIYVSLALLRPRTDRVNPIYLRCAINNPDTKHQFDSSIKGIGVPNLHLGEIKKTKILLPLMDKQNEFVSFVEQTNKSKLTIQASLDKLEVMKKALMQEYFG